MEPVYRLKIHIKTTPNWPVYNTDYKLSCAGLAWAAYCEACELYEKKAEKSEIENATVELLAYFDDIQTTIGERKFEKERKNDVPSMDQK